MFGGDLTLNTFGEYGDPNTPDADNIMHGQLRADNGFTLMAADTPLGMEHTPGGNITISLSGDDENEPSGYWDKLSEGGSVTMPFEKQMWGRPSACAPTSSVCPGWWTSYSRKADHLLGDQRPLLVSRKSARPGGWIRKSATERHSANHDA